MQIQCLNKPQGNYVRHCWGTTPISGEVGLTARLHPLRSTTPVTSRCTRCVALHPLRSTTPVTSRYTRSERVHCLRIGCIAYGSGAPHNAGTHHRRLCRPHTYHPQAGTHETTKPQAPPATTEHGLTGNTSKPTGPAHKPHPTHNEAATGFPATASSRSAALSEAPPIRRSCPRGPRPRRGQPRGGQRGRGTASRTRSPGPHCGRSGSTAGRHRARHTRRA